MFLFLKLYGVCVVDFSAKNGGFILDILITDTAVVRCLLSVFVVRV